MKLSEVRDKWSSTVEKLSAQHVESSKKESEIHLEKYLYRKELEL